MKFLIHSPCDSCPFRTDVKFYLRRNRRQVIADGLRHDQMFICHKTVDYSGGLDEDGKHKTTDNEQHCAGALIILAKSPDGLFANVMYRLAVWAKMFDPDKLKMDAPVFETLDDFVEGSE